ncbi:hypothetical protein F5887DRAFT_963989 [Amanita rubescens]|nr:hypothetical protein F5887DRAFT_963989 [Amanita rubescens]
MPPQTSLDPQHSGPTMHHANPVIAFIIGLSIILLASILNAAGLNLTKLDHVRTSKIPKASRRKDWMRPLWLLGMILYILSQLIGSTLALEYMRAEYVAPLGSSSLIFNFLFARFLVGTPVTRNDIYGTIVIVVGVVGIVAFGSINSGLTTEIDAARLSALWGRAGWLGYFFAMTFTLILLLVFISRLESVLSARNEITPGSEDDSSSKLATGTSCWDALGAVGRAVIALRLYWRKAMVWATEKLEAWAGPKPDKQVAWALGIGWACCGGGLAGGCLVFAKASVKLISGSLSQENRGNQFGHVSTIFTFILLVITAVMQIICLNKALKVYDSTLVVPVFYGVYTVTGFLNSLVFNNEVGAYSGWTLFLIFLSILVLIAGVVLLTLKKPEPPEDKIKSATLSAHPRRTPIRSARPRTARSARIDLESQGEHEDDGERNNERDVLWEVGHASDDDDQGEDEDIDHHQHPLYSDDSQQKGQTRTNGEREEGVELVSSNGGEDLLRRHSLGDATKKKGSWNSAGVDRQPCQTS